MMHDIAIIGAGLSGIGAALAAASAGVERVVLLEQRPAAGGFTSVYHKSTEFAAESRFVQSIERLEYPVYYRSTVVGLFSEPADEGHLLIVQTAGAMMEVRARKVVIAAGALEKPREAAGISGSRPAGVMTPYLAAALLDAGYRLGERPVVFDTGRHARAVIQLAVGNGLTPIVVNTEDLRSIAGRSRIESIDVASGNNARSIACDSLIYAKGRYGATFFLKSAPIKRRPDDLTLASERDGSTSIPGVYAAGSCTVHGDVEHRNSVELGQLAMQTLMKAGVG